MATTRVVCTAGVGEIGLASVALPQHSGSKQNEALRASKRLAVHLAAAVCSPKCAALLRPDSNCTYEEEKDEPLG